jgi:hypothetical protein
VRRLKACTDVEATPGSPRRRRKPPGPDTTAMPAAAPPWWSSCFQAGLVFRPAGFLITAVGAAKNPPRNGFSPTPQGGFCMPWAGSSFAASAKSIPAAPAETTYEDRPLTSSALLPRPVLGEPCGGSLRPWFVARPARQHTSDSSKGGQTAILVRCPADYRNVSGTADWKK